MKSSSECNIIIFDFTSAKLQRNNFDYLKFYKMIFKYCKSFLKFKLIDLRPNSILLKKIGLNENG